ncbi:hypothetical protein GC102_09365 [Paenibacillus sp. LMG 31460]|uniref:Uncharacterized protein n=2 Tax=Paenibacillus germinis TaxID=2654979 RepID=A0ABX1YYG1_9BACL|nr:hypothetical protein [Paenibacillus germinis]
MKFSQLQKISGINRMKNKKGVTMNTYNTIYADLLPETLWKSSLSCSECLHKLNENSAEMLANKREALEVLRRQIACNPIRVKLYKDYNQGDYYISQLSEDGRFADLGDSFKDVYDAILRLTSLSEPFHWSREQPMQDENLKSRIFKGIAFYCKMEADREDKKATRFHNSVFALPLAAVNLFVFFLDDMEAIEKGTKDDSLTKEVHKQLSRCALQAWTLPLRGDHTDSHPISPERFRMHVWWVGGNALTYRPSFYTAVMLQSVEMIDTMIHVVSHIFTPTSHTNSNESYWDEGICADGFGWGHGPQAYNSGYPKDGILSGLNIIKDLKGTPWEKEITYRNMDWLINFIRGISWSHYKGFDAPMQSRHIFTRKMKDDVSYIYNLAQLLIENFSYLLTEEQLKEMNDLLDHKDVQMMDGYPSGYYKGVRYFWNNDDLIKKTDKLYFYLNMASNRCDGVEFAHIMADKLNLFTADGSYVIAGDGTEWAESKGAWELASLPGITARYIETAKLVPGTNWSGYNSIHPYAGGVARNDNGAAGFIFEKDDRKKLDGAGVIHQDGSKEIFGVKAHKGYFIIGDTIVCLGAGISDHRPEMGSEIRTTINQTKWATDILYHTAGSPSIETYGMDKNGVKVTLKGCESRSKDIPWVKQDGILYAVLPEHTSGEVVMLAEERKTHWELLNFTNNEADNELCPIFQIWVNHGAAPVDCKYSYLMYAGDQEPQSYLASNPVQIISNTTKLQAVANNSMIQAVFYDNETVCSTETLKMKVSKPTVVMLEQEGDKLFITVSDPNQDVNLDELIIYLTIPLVGDGNTIDNEWHAVPIKMPGIPEVGKPNTVVVNLK